MHDLFHIFPSIIPRLGRWLILWSQDDTWADMEKAMY
jgi:hypothetical protein